MKHVMPLIFLCLAVAGCKSLQAVRLPADELHAEIRAGSLFERGDKIELTQSDGTEYVLTVYGVDDHALHGETKGGEDIDVAIDDIVAMNTRQFSVLGTVAAAPFIALGTVFLLLLSLSGIGPLP